ncbi:Zinc finger FYVE domain-containing protein 26-like [Oopsacas minuta]|uniref:Zinc finger FYVE domain-containing protein 26-like n=1 Tax=Oopsacas minuta TaxID=111878 RepID=A0AAV7KGI2_9METZ|nr:Zinc finger FYVE domain-containing protein 26-like [Oopsacas minuta]
MLWCLTYPKQILFVVQFALQNLSAYISCEELEHLRRLQIGSQALLCIDSHSVLQYTRLTDDVVLLVEQLIMNLKIPWAAEVVNRVSRDLNTPIPSSFVGIYTSLIASIDEMAFRYAELAIDLKCTNEESLSEVSSPHLPSPNASVFQFEPIPEMSPDHADSGDSHTQTKPIQTGKSVLPKTPMHYGSSAPATSYISGVRKGSSQFTETKIRKLFEKITKDALQLQTSMLQKFKDIDFQISTMGIHLARNVLVPQQLSELSAFQCQFNIILEIQSDLEKLLKKKRWYTNTIELVIRLQSANQLADKNCINPMITPKIPVRNPKRKIVIERQYRPILPRKESTSSLSEANSTMINNISPNLIESTRKKRVGNVDNHENTQQPCSSNNHQSYEPTIDDHLPKSQEVNIENNMVNKQTTQSYTILDNPGYFSQENQPSASVDLSETLPISSLSLSNTQTEDLNFTSMLFDCSDNIPVTQATHLQNSPVLTQNFNSQICDKFDTQNFLFSQSQELTLLQDPKCHTFKDKYINQQTNNKYSILENNRCNPPNKNEDLWDKQNIPNNFFKTETNLVKQTNALFSNSSQDFSANKLIETSTKSKCYSQSHDYNSKKLISKVAKSQPSVPDCKQLSILNYVSPPRSKNDSKISLKKISNSQANKAKSFPSGKNTPNHPQKVKNQNPKNCRKLDNRPFYSMNILIIQRDEITNDLPTTLWTCEEIPADVISQLACDLIF